MKNKKIILILICILLIGILWCVIFPQTSWSNLRKSPGFGPELSMGFEYWEKYCLGYEKEVFMTETTLKKCYGITIGPKKCFGNLEIGGEVSQISCGHQFYPGQKI